MQPEPRIKKRSEAFLTAEVWQRIAPVMKWLVFLAVMAPSILLTGCVVGRQELVLDTVGPASVSPPPHSLAGSLTVYTAYDVHAHFNSRHDYGREYSDYEIFTRDGTLLKRVHNNSDSILDEPARVALPPGKYQVVARANGMSRVSVPVVIEPQRSTVVHLDDGRSWPGEMTLNATNVVRLPDGFVVGYRMPQP
jgi:hypothetical protein